MPNSIATRLARCRPGLQFSVHKKCWRRQSGVPCVHPPCCVPSAETAGHTGSDAFCKRSKFSGCRKAACERPDCVPAVWIFSFRQRTWFPDSADRAQGSATQDRQKKEKRKAGNAQERGKEIFRRGGAAALPAFAHAKCADPAAQQRSGANSATHETRAPCGFQRTAQTKSPGVFRRPGPYVGWVSKRILMQ